jgi:hypothetical protein
MVNCKERILSYCNVLVIWKQSIKREGGAYHLSVIANKITNPFVSKCKRQLLIGQVVVKKDTYIT